MQSAFDSIVELSRDSPDLVAWALAELLDLLAKVRHGICLAMHAPDAD
jgi:hypothetical protein